MSRRLTSERLQVPDSTEAVTDLFLEKGWTDGLPIVPPTEEAVERMLAGTNRSPADVIATIPPLNAEATLEKIAINAVMAGCRPEYMPVIVTAIAAMCEEPFNLRSVQPTTHPVSPLVIVNGPIAGKLNINGKSGAFGPGWRANATIGRAIRLILTNVGGAIPGKSAMASQAQPSKYTFCIAENEEDSPWQPLHVERGFAASDSTVTVVAVENPHNINDHDANTGEQVLATIAGSVATMGNNNVLNQNGTPVIALSPEHAATIAGSGFSKNDVKAYIHEKGRIPRRNFHERVIAHRFPNFADDAMIPLVPNKEDIIVIVVGGPGKHSSFMPSFNGVRSVTRAIA